MQSDTPALHDLSTEDTSTINDTLFTVNVNDTFTTNAVSTKDDDSFWILFLDRSQLVMTLIGVIANSVTTITLTKNRQVCEIFPWSSICFDKNIPCCLTCKYFIAPL